MTDHQEEQHLGVTKKIPTPISLFGDESSLTGSDRPGIAIEPEVHPEPEGIEVAELISVLGEELVREYPQE